VPKLRVQAHDGDVMALSFNPYQEHLLLTSATDRTVRLWDMRALKEPMHTFVGHTDDVTGLAWAPFEPSVFASCGADRKVIVWDCARIGEEQSPEDAEDGPPELLVRGRGVARSAG
jgi:histone-binding protein RBBP4